MKIPFNRPYMTGKELYYISEAHHIGNLSGDGPFTDRCHGWLQERAEVPTLLTHSCTAALEMAAMLINVRPGDEIIMPSYTFVSTANAFVLRGGVPVFVDIRPDTLNLDESRIEEAITPRTKAIVPVHYAGVGCEMDVIMAVARKHGLVVVEDAAQGVMATYKDRALGGIGHLGAYSFHETKNVISGEGGALLLGDRNYVELAEIVREKGTDRSRFFRGEVDKYTWQHVGSSFLPSELTAAFLWAQLQEATQITAERMAIWQMYHGHPTLQGLEQRGLLRRPYIPDECGHNAHMYYVLLPELEIRRQVLAALKEQKIGAIFHYVPLHSSPAGQKFGRAHGDLAYTVDLSERIVRLPLWIGMDQSLVDRVVGALSEALESACGA